MRVMVFGASGRLGSELCRQLGTSVFAVARDRYDFAQPGSVCTLLADSRPDVVINAAAFTDVDLAEDQPDLCRLVNVSGIRELASACNSVRALLVQISTDYVFGNHVESRRPWRESDRPVPLGVYAQSKLEGESFAAESERHLIIRTCGLYGPPGARSRSSFVEKMLELGQAGKPLKVVEDQACTPTFTPHLARAILYLIQQECQGELPGGIYHLTNDGATNWYEFACAIFETIRWPVFVKPCTRVDFESRAPRPEYTVLDNSKYLRTGGPTMPHWRAALKENLQAMQKIRS